MHHHSLRITPLSRPVQPPISHLFEQTPADKAAEQVWIAKQKALRAQFEAEWVPPPGYSPEAEREEMTNVDDAAFDVWLERRKGRVAAASTPVWMDPLEFWLIYGPELGDTGVLAQQPTAVSLTVPFRLKGGGELEIAFETYKRVNDDREFGPPLKTWMQRKLPCRVRTEHGVFTGWLEHECGERSWYVVSFPEHTPQDVADRVAATLDILDGLDLRQDYPAVMPLSGRCAICSRPLTDLVSKTLGIGPDCAGRLGVAHSPAAADAIVAKRQALAADLEGAR